MVKPISANETQRFEETKKKKKETDLSQYYSSSIHPHRSILQHKLQGGVAIFVVLGQLSRLPHLLCIGDPHPSTLRDKETGGKRERLDEDMS